jgi:beta-N-acetylhexosaminidase
MTPQEKAATLVVSGLPAREGVGGVIVQAWSRRLPRPAGALVFVDQEGGPVRGLPELPPAKAPAEMATPAEARAAGRATATASRRAGVHVDLAPVLDSRRGPLGSRHFRSPGIGIAFARGLAQGGVAACAKHFPGLGSTAISTDERPGVRGVVTKEEFAAFRAAVRAGVPCVMVGHAFYPILGPYRASMSPAAYRLLRSLGFRGVAVTDSLNIVKKPPPDWPVRALRAGADLLLFTGAAQARRAIAQLVPLARRGELDAHVRRVLRFRERYAA